jgi:membrane-associated phospholipid phosphatase
MQTLSIMATKYMLIFAILLFFNYMDMYTTLILVIIVGSCSIGTGFFKLIYKNPRPFFHEDWVKVYDCETGYGNPSGHSIVAFAVYLTLWKILRKRNVFFEKNKRKLFIFLFFYMCCILMSRLALGAHSLNQILLGSFIGYQIYTLFFEVIKIDLHLHTEMNVVMNLFFFKVGAYIISSFLIFGILIFNFFPLTINLDINQYLERIIQSCPGTPYSKIFDFEAYFMLAACSSIVGAHYGIYFDVKFNLNNSIEKWIEMNHGDKLWNKTNFITSILRLFSMSIVLAISFCLNFIISSNAHTNYIFILKNLIPYFFVNFALFGFCRSISCKLGLANKKLNKIE